MSRVLFIFSISPAFKAFKKSLTAPCAVSEPLANPFKVSYSFSNLAIAESRSPLLRSSKRSKPLVLEVIPFSSFRTASTFEISTAADAVSLAFFYNCSIC
jgi:hypothetical protein